MSEKEEKNEEEIHPEEDAELEASEAWITYLSSLRTLVYDQPDIIFSILQELLDLLVAAKVIKAEDIELLIRTGVNRWRQGS